MPRAGVLFNQAENPESLDQEGFAQFRRDSPIPLACFIQFSLRDIEETQAHFEVYFAITSDSETARISPRR